MRVVLRSLAVVLALAAPPVWADCLSDPQVATMFEHYTARTPAPNPQGLTDAGAACTRAKLQALLLKKHGQVVGYKAGLTNPAVQKRFNASQPVWGALYPGMLLRDAGDGVSVDAAFGARPLFEADLLVRVRSEAINRARTPDAVLETIDQLIPFIELPDLMVQAPPQLNGSGVTAINVGARLGVMGRPVAVGASPAERTGLFDALRDMSIVMADGSGTELARGKGSDILDHPLNAVVWLVEALAREGIALKPGDLISLGSFSPLLPPKPGLKVTVTYGGLPGAQPVSVSFR